MNCTSVQKHDFNSIYTRYHNHHPLYQKAEKLEKLEIYPVVEERGVRTKSYHASLRRGNKDVFILSADGDSAKKPYGESGHLINAIAQLVKNMGQSPVFCTVEKIN